MELLFHLQEIHEIVDFIRVIQIGKDKYKLV